MMICASCTGNSKAHGNKQALDTLWNDSVQNSFFGVNIGDSISKVIETFETRGLVLDREVSTNAILCFSPAKGGRITVAKMDWENLNVYAINERFMGLRFSNTYDDKAAAMARYDSTKNAIATKYKITEGSSDNPNVYALSLVFGKNKTGGATACFKRETLDKEFEIFYTTVAYGTSREFDVADVVSDKH